MTFPVPLACAGDFAGLADLDLDLLPSVPSIEPNNSIIFKLLTSGGGKKKKGKIQIWFFFFFYQKKWSDADSCHAELVQSNHFPVV